MLLGSAEDCAARVAAEKLRLETQGFLKLRGGDRVAACCRAALDAVNPRFSSCVLIINFVFLLVFVIQYALHEMSFQTLVTLARRRLRFSRVRPIFSALN